MPITEEEIERLSQKKQDALDIKEYKTTQKIKIMTTRFNTETLEENRKYREQNWKNGCIYCCPQEVSKEIPLKSKMIVLEMNNDTNKIVAIGMCANNAIVHKYSVYGNNNYNRFNYIGKHRISRSEMTSTEEAVLNALDQLCFYGNEHMKRGNGMKLFPVIKLIRCKPIIDIPGFLDNMFITRFSKK
jgi:hypothetical protein